MDEKKIFEEFKIRKKRQIISSAILIALMVYVIIAGEKPELRSPGIPEAYLIYIIIGVFIAVVAFSFFNWRCPACKKYLGRGLKHESCKNCGVRLQ